MLMLRRCFVVAALLLLLLQVATHCHTATALHDKVTTPLQPYYRAAVFEYAPLFRDPALNVTREEALAIVNTNLDAYEQAVINASKAGAQIIVFPEDGLYGFLNCKRNQIEPYLEAIPTAQEMVTPCDEPAVFADRPVLLRVSCLAARYKMVVVLDMGDVQNCSRETDAACPPDGRYQYNTQVAFSETGQLLAKYHKYHLFYEPQYNTPALPEVVYFDTSFGVRFGMMVCFDIMFADPSIDLVADYGITDIAYSSWWVNTPPSFTATSWYQAWTRHFEINLIAAGGVMEPAWVFSGSGMFSAGAPLATVFNTDSVPKNTLLVTNVPKLSFTDTSAPLATQSAARRWLRSRHLAAQVHEHHCQVSQHAGRALVQDDEWAFTPFLATAGARGLVHATVGVGAEALTCYASYVVGAAVAAAPKWYAVLAHQGSFQGFYNEQFCGLYICSNSSYCAEATLDGAVPFTFFELSGDFSVNTTAFGLVSGDNGSLLPRDQVAFDATAAPTATGQQPLALRSLWAAQVPVPVLGAGIVGLFQHRLLPPLDTVQGS